MKRLLAGVVAGLLLIPHGVALGAELDELLEESRSASYSAEQLISCATPDGVRDALIELQQRAGEVRYFGKSKSTTEVWSGYGGWVVQSDGSVIDSANVDGEEVLPAEEPRYQVEEAGQALYLGRRADTYVLRDGELARAELIVDRATGVIMSVVTFDDEGGVYCERTFVSYNPNVPEWPVVESDPDSEALVASSESTLPEELAGFTRLDVYVDDDGLDFGYYSDGFFSFAVFESDVEIVLDGGVVYRVDGGSYAREFTPGQVTYTWPISNGGMALIGDLPPDMHDAVLAELPQPYDPGFFKRLWRSLFG